MKKRSVEDKPIRLGDRAAAPGELAAALLEGQTRVLGRRRRQTPEEVGATYP